MEKIGKRAIISSAVKLVVFVVVIILLYLLIKNSWNVNNTFKDMLSLWD